MRLTEYKIPRFGFGQKVMWNGSYCHIADVTWSEDSKEYLYTLYPDDVGGYIFVPEHSINAVAIGGHLQSWVVFQTCDINK